MSDNQASQSGQGDGNLELQNQYIHRILLETAALNRLHELEVTLSDDLTALETELHQINEESETADRNDKLAACIQKITDRFDNFQSEINKYGSIELRGPWSLTEEVQEALDQQTADLQKLDQQWETFFGPPGENRNFENSSGIIAKWITQAHDSTYNVVNSMERTLAAVARDMHASLIGQSHLMEAMVNHVDEIRDDVRADRDVLNSIATGIKKMGQAAEPDLQKWLHEVADRVQKAAGLDSIQERLDAQRPVFEELRNKLSKLKEMEQGIVDIKAETKQISSRPVIDNSLLISMHTKMESLTRDGHPKLDAIHKGMVTMIEKQDINEDIRERIKAMATQVAELQSQEKPDIMEMKGNLRHIEGQLRGLKLESPDDYSQKLEEITELLKEANDTEDENSKRLDELKSYLEELQKKPETDPELIRGMQNVLQDIREHQSLPDFDSVFKEFSEKLEHLTEENKVAFQTVNSNLDAAKGTLKDIKVKFGQTNKELGSISQSLGSVDHHLEAVDKSLDGVHGKLDSAKNDMSAVKGNTEGLNTDIRGVRGLLKDHSDNIKAEMSKVHGNLENINQKVDFSDIHGKMDKITGSIGNYQSTSVLDHLEGLHKDIHDNPIFNLNPDDIQNGFTDLKNLIEGRPQVDQQPVLDQLAGIKHQTEIANENLAGLNGVAQDVHYLRNRPTLGPSDLRDVATPLHNKLDTLRGPILNLEGSILTQDYFDRRLPAAAFTEDRDRSRAILDTIHDTQNQVNQISQHPGFDPQPVNNLHRDVNQLQLDHKNNIESLKTQLENVPQTVGVHVNELKSEVKQDFNQFTKQLEEINQQQAESNRNMKLVRNLSLGAAILSGVTLAGVLGVLVLRPLFGKKKQKTAVEKRNLESQERRLHARSWNRK